VTIHEALEVLAEHRRDQIVIATMSAVGIWPSLSDTEADFSYIPSTMGQGPSLGLGLALAQKKRPVIVINGDGCMLMNLGCVATIADNPADLCTIVLNNGIYEVTGGQRTAGGGNIRFAEIARACGIEQSYTFSDTEEWQDSAAAVLEKRGPVFIELVVEPRYGQETPRSPRPMNEQIERLRRAIV
jgi:thiamine pyrophosphate-dependent acetolactate synthase large subunit-like protein